MVKQTQAIGERSSAVGKRANALSFGQLILVIGFGLVLWFAGVMAVRFGSPAGLFGPTASLIAFAVIIPISWLSVLFIKKAAKLEVGQTLPAIALGTVAATSCDGIGLTWGNGLYGTDPVMTTFGAAWILWGAGFFLLFAYFEDYRQASVTD